MVNIVINSGAEAGNLTGWSSGLSYSTGWQVASGAGGAHRGSYYFASYCTSDCAPMSQNVSLIIGFNYSVSFWYHFGPEPCNLSLKIGKNTLFSLENTAQTQMPYTQYIGTFTASNSVETLSILGVFGGNFYEAVDDIEVSLIAPTSEPTLTPTDSLTIAPSAIPISAPTDTPTTTPSPAPTIAPITPTSAPSSFPTTITNLVANSGAETGTSSGWTAGAWSVVNTSPHSGSYAFYTNCIISGCNPLSQSIFSLIPGSNYKVTFWTLSSANNAAKISLSVGSNVFFHCRMYHLLT